MRELFHQEPLLLLGVLTLAGYYMGRVARVGRLPSLIGYMVLGVLLGPSAIGLFDAEHLEGFSFITEIALGFVAFGIGAELNLQALKQLGSGIVTIIFAESLTAFVVVTLAVYAVTRSWPVALLFGGVAPASAPAGTVAVIQEYRAQGSLTKALYAVVGFDDGLAIIIFGFAAALARVLLMGTLGVEGAEGGMLAAMKEPGFEVGGSILVGGMLGLVYTQLVSRLESPRDFLIMTIGIVFIATGLCTHFHFSLILTNMVIGFIFVNTRREAFVHRVTAPLQEIMPFTFILFFSLAGAHLKISELPALGMVGIVYILARSGGLIGGARIGSSLGHVEDKIKKYIGLGILSQAGVAIGLSLIVREQLHEFARQPAVADALTTYSQLHADINPMLYDPVHIGSALITTITATCIVFEVIGPILTKIALEKAGEIGQAGR